MTIRSFSKKAVFGALPVALLGGAAIAETALPLLGPVPSVRPAGMSAGIAIDPARFGGPAPVASPVPLPAAQTAPRPASTTLPSDYTASISSMMPRQNQVTPIQGTLRDGLDALSNRNADKARAIRDGMMPGSLDRHILAWAIGLRGGEDVPAAEIARTVAELEDWPGMSALRANSEEALYREEWPASQVIAAFSASSPETAKGAMALARAYLQTGQTGKAKDLIQTVWRKESFDRDTEEEILEVFGNLLTTADHKYRMNRLLYNEQIDDAERIASLAVAHSLFEARAATIRNQSNAAELIAAVHPSHHSDPSYLFAKVEYFRRNGQPENAAAALMKAPNDPEALIDPDKWWNERRIVSRDLLDRGKPQLAYQVAANHSATGDAAFAEAEFHAGWYALRYLNDPKTALRHFAALEKISSKPLSLSRAYYWLGRASEAANTSNADGYYRRAAQYNGTYYGQLAAAHLGLVPNDIAYPEPSAAERQRFASREAVRAIKRLEEVDYEWRANSLYRDLAKELKSPGELALLAVMAEDRGDYDLALQIGKLAYWDGVDAPALAFPVGVIPANANISAAGKALAYAIARQESAFNPAAVSSAGALGLLQLMPATAKAVAGRVGLAYSRSRLTSDPAYNATLGSRFLGEQISDFGGSYVLTFAAYNAGPSRAREWIERFGDPRGMSLYDVIDWVERIPYSETRNYVQRVMENYQVYKMRLGAGFDIENDLRLGRTS